MATAKTFQATRPPRDGVFRDSGSKTGVPPCVERDHLDQAAPAGVQPAPRLCVKCGRITQRRDDRGMASCSGELITGVTWTDPLPPGARYVGKDA